METLLKIQRKIAYKAWLSERKEILKHERTTENIMRLGVLNDRIATYEAKHNINPENKEV